MGWSKISHGCRRDPDYARMREMIFGDPPTLDHIFEVLREIEARVNTAR